MCACRCFFAPCNPLSDRVRGEKASKLVERGRKKEKRDRFRTRPSARERGLSREATKKKWR